jgi:GTP cyclohydrolase II
MDAKTFLDRIASLAEPTTSPADAAPSVRHAASTELTTEFGVFRLHGFVDERTGHEHAALTIGELDGADEVLVRLHSECLTGDALHSLHCDCGPQLRRAMQLIGQAQRGALLYLRQEGRGIGLVNKIRAYELQRAGHDTVDANRLLGLPDDARDYSVAAQMLSQLGVQRVRLLTNNPAKIAALAELGIQVTERVALHVGRNAFNAGYMSAKEQRMGHVAPA